MCEKAPILTLENPHSGYLGRLGKEQQHESCELLQLVLDPGYHSSHDTQEDRLVVSKEFKRYKNLYKDYIDHFQVLSL